MRANSSGGGIKALFLQHVEKVVLGIAMVLVALFLWSATGVKPIDATKSPEALKKGAEEQIARIPEAPAPEISPLRNFEKSVEAGLTPIEEVSLYAHSTKINPDIQPAIIKRADPTLFAVEDLRVAATVLSVPEEGITPTLNDTTKENEKKKTLKKAVKKKYLDGEEPQPRRRVRRSQPGYGAPSKLGYGQSSSQLPPEAIPPPHAGGRGGRRGRGGESADTSSATTGYGPPPGVGYGASMVSAGPHPGAQVAQTENAKGEVRLAVVVTGRVPYARQFEEYQKRFKEAATFEGHSPELDVPRYLLFKVERQEVTATGATEWKALDLDAREKLEVNWIAAAEEMVDPTYIYGNEQAPNILAWPMPPAIQRDWRRLQTHPSVPMAWMDMEELQAGSMKREYDPQMSRAH